MLVLIGAGAWISWGAIQDLRQANAAEAVMETLQAYAPLSAALQNERIASQTGGSKDEIAAAREKVDDALDETREYTGKLDLSLFPAVLVSQFRQVQEKYATDLPRVRAEIDRGAAGPYSENAYSAIVSSQLDLVTAIGNSMPNREVARYIDANQAIGETANQLITEMIQGIRIMGARGEATEAMLQAYANMSTASELSRLETGTSVRFLDDTNLTMPAQDPSATFSRIRAYVADGSGQALSQFKPEEYPVEFQGQLERLSTLNTGILVKGEKVAAAAASDARSQTFLTIAVTILAAALSFLFAMVVSRAIVVPLRRLTRAAADVREQLPRIVEQVAVPGEGPELTLEPIPVTSRDEVGQLAAAFNSVNSTTVEVAQEQAALRGSIAEMFVNVARRDQVLLNRQLSFIDSLERSEEDPGTLANLFRLDHLATRMRRNAESLLVLAGIDSGRRLRDAMPLSDVIRTASSEIEQYDRVELDLHVDPHMLGFNALGAAHLLAELLENATVFSEPETPVTVSTGVSQGSVIVRIADRGLGMSDEEIDAANAKISSTSAGDALGNQRLGLFVVGRLAVRLGAQVRLQRGASGSGTDAVVYFPAALFAATETPLYTPSAPASGEVPVVEAPVVQEVDLNALTDGATDGGLPRRRRGDSTEVPAVAPAAPAAPVAPAAQGGSQLPTRPRKTFDEDNLVLPAAPTPVLSSDLGSGASEWTPPAIAPAANAGLPSRTRTSAWAAPQPEAPAAPAEVPAPAARAGLFSGFRGRSVVEGEGGDLRATGVGGDEVVRAPWMSLGAHAAPPQPIVVPEVAEDEEPWTPQLAEDEDDAPVAAAEPEAVEEQVAPIGFASDEDETEQPWAPAEPLAAAAEAWAPVEVEPEPAPQAEAAQEEPWAPVQASEEQAWAPAQAADEQPWAPVQAAEEQPWAPVQAADEQPWAPVQAAEEQPWAPVQAAEEQPWAPVQAAEEQPWAPVQAADEQPWAPAQAAEEQPWAPVPAAEEQPLPSRAQHAAQWAAAPEADPVDHASADVEPVAEQPVASDEPAFTPSYEPAHDEVEAPAAHWTEYTTSSEAADEAPVAEVAQAEPTAEAAPAARTPISQAFTSYSGYAGWAGRRAAAPTPQTTFAESLAAARAWHSQEEQPVAETPAFEAPVVEEEAPAWQPQAVQPPTFEPAAEAQDEPVWSPQTAQEAWPQLEPDVDATQLVEPVVEEPIEEPVAQAPAVETPAFEAPTYEAPAFEAPAYEAPAFEQPAAVAPSVAEQAPVVAPDPVVAQAPAQPSWAPTASGAETPAEEPRQRKLFGMFGRRKQVTAPVAAEAAPEQPVRESAWGAPAAPVAPSAPAPAAGWQAPAWQAPAAPAPAPQTSAAEQSPVSGWAPPEWATRPQNGAPHVSTVPQPSLPPSVAPSVGALSDEVAAMLALRSDIQEQALSELSQLSAYRPAAMGSPNASLQKRVPTAIPRQAPVEDAATPIERDADQLRSRLSSFQSGTTRGRRASLDENQTSTTP
ncbi:sensor histidine kinase [Cellulomonas massiliensis]|uniref:sensor histidine kinase n=1 Tax=Cellulomonas massiliensis TaxID=1465811 RepID=UPI000474FAB7|nr:sensor histidine kinase [Cellulomonas massiliensis]